MTVEFILRKSKEESMMNENVKKILKEQTWMLATCSDEPNAVPIGFKDVTDDGKLVIGDVFLETTMKNIKGNGRAAVSAFDPKTSEGYQIKGSAVYITEGPIVDKFKALASDLFHGAMTAKGAVVITPEKIIVTSPGPDNKKEI